METFNKNGDKRGMHTNQCRGAKHFNSKGWILYKNEEEIGYFASMSEAAQEIGKSYPYLWQLYKGRHIGKDGKPLTKTKEGYHLKPAISISFTDK